MIISISNPSHVYPIYSGATTQRTCIQSKREIDQIIQLYYKHGSQASCATCLVSPKVTGRKCPIFDPKTYSTDTRCPQYSNFIGYARVTEIKKYDSFEGISADAGRVKAWSEAEGFSSVEEAKEHYRGLMGKEWESYPLTVISWEIKRRI
jgi:hypothetical protein